ncbi:helix-turn-helix domain-containing protein [Guggenheimella bovis]
MSAVKEIMKNKEVKPSVLCNRLGIKSNVLSERFKQKNVSVKKLNEMLRAMDYKIIVVPRETRLPKDGYVIGESDELKVDSDSFLSD